MGPLDAETARVSLVYLVVVVVGLSMWVVLLFPGRYERYLLSPATLLLVLVAWLALTFGLVLGKRLGV